MRSITVAMLLMSCFAGCTTEGGGARTAANQPRAASSEYLVTQGAGMLMDPVTAEGKFMLALSLRWVKAPPAGALLVAEFENKADPSSPHRIEVPVDHAKRDLVVKSPPYGCVFGQSQYRAVVRVFADESKQVVLGTHEQLVAVPVSAAQIRQLGGQPCGA